MFEQIRIDIQHFKDWVKSGRTNSYSDFTQNRNDEANAFNDQLCKEIENWGGEIDHEQVMGQLRNVPKDQLEGYVLMTKNISHLNPDPLILKGFYLSKMRSKSGYINIRYNESTQNLEVYIKKK